MVKIKRKVALEPKEFLKYLLKKEETTVELNGYTSDGEIFSFEPEVTINEFVSYYPYDNTYTVEIEEEVTEETKLPKCLEISFDRKSGRDVAVVHENCSVKQLPDRNPEHSLDIRTIHLVNDDGTVELIWKDGEMVGDEQWLTEKKQLKLKRHSK